MSTDDNPLTGVVVALSDEAASLLGVAPLPGTITAVGPLRIYLSGMGPDRASQAAKKLLDAGCRRLLSWGTAGALNTTLDSGDVIIPQAIVDETGKAVHTDTSWREAVTTAMSIPVCDGRLLGATRVISSLAEKQQFHTSIAADAVDMESLAIASVADQAGIPFLCVRSIVDTPQLAVPGFAQDMVDEYGRALFGPTLRGIAQHPGQIGALMRLGRAFKAALSSLRSIAQVIMEEAHGPV